MTMDRRMFVGGLLSAGTLLALRPGRVLGALGGGALLDWDELAAGAHAMVDLSTGGNSLILIDDERALVIDTKSPLLGAAIRGDAEAFGARAEVTLLNTHHHGDHTGGNAAFADVESYAHRNALPRVRAQLERYTRAAREAKGDTPELESLARLVREAAPSWTEETFVPDHAIGDEGATLKVGARAVEVHHFGAGHTDNDLVARIPSLNLIHTGDLVFSGLHPFYDPEGGYSGLGWVASLQRTLALCDGETVVVPGHGAVGDRSIIQGAIRYHEQLIDAVQRELDKGTSRADAQEMSWDFMDGLGFESIRPRAIGAVYDELSGG
ncbi:MAG: MBL fold metallo-hydrolase [Phycisphaerales bacterium JB059]